MKRVSGAASIASRTSRDEFWYPSEALTIRMPASAAWSKALAMSAVEPSPLWLSARSGMAFVSGATPMIPTPFSGATIVPVMCVPCQYSSSGCVPGST